MPNMIEALLAIMSISQLFFLSSSVLLTLCCASTVQPGCMNGMLAHLPEIIPFLLQTMSDPKVCICRPDILIENDVQTSCAATCGELDSLAVQFITHSVECRSCVVFFCTSHLFHVSSHSSFRFPNSSQALVRSITCWTMSRYGKWIVQQAELPFFAQLMQEVFRIHMSIIGSVEPRFDVAMPCVPFLFSSKPSGEVCSSFVWSSFSERQSDRFQASFSSFLSFVRHCLFLWSSCPL